MSLLMYTLTCVAVFFSAILFRSLKTNCVEIEKEFKRNAPFFLQMQTQCNVSSSVQCIDVKMAFYLTPNASLLIYFFFSLFIFSVLQCAFYLLHKWHKNTIASGCFATFVVCHPSESVRNRVVANRKRKGRKQAN